MTATHPLPRPDRWHRPLLWLAALMGVLTLVTVVLSVVDPSPVTGHNAWFKPLKFAVSIAIYALTLAWLIGQVRRFRRLADIAGTVTVIALLIEMVIIVGAAAAGITSHFNVATPFNAALWAAMAGSIVVVWVLALAIGIALLFNPLPDRARTRAIRAGVLFGVVGMGLAFLMTSPTAEQLANFQGIAGAHAVGVADDGPGLPVLGWSTVGGDLRIPHFVGMHGLQAIPLALLAIELLSRRVPVLRDEGVRERLVWVLSLAFAAALAVVTWQAVSGQSIVRPAGAVLVAGLATAGATLLAITGVLLTGPRPHRERALHRSLPLLLRSLRG
jgi:hypothetical protein